MKKLSKMLADKLVQNGANAEIEDVYAYGIECTLSTLLIVILQIAAGLVLGKPLQMLVFILA